MRAGSIFFGLLFAAMVVVGEKIHAGDWEFQMFSAGDIVWLIVYFWDRNAAFSHTVNVFL